MSISQDELARLLAIVDRSEAMELKLEVDGLRLHVSRGAGHDEKSAAAFWTSASPAASALPAAPAETAEAASVASERAASREDRDGQVTLRAPMLGTFYRAPAPDAPPFVEVGDTVKADDTVCLIEVMKLFTSIPAGTDGRVVGIPAENGGRVEYDQALLVIEKPA